VGDLGTASVAAVLTLGYLVALRPLRTWLEQVAAKAHCSLEVTLAPGADPVDLIEGVDGRDGVTLRLRTIEKRDGRMVAIVDVEGRPDSAVCAMTGRLAARGEVTDLALR
jgi:hypothetical protein